MCAGDTAGLEHPLIGIIGIVGLLRTITIHFPAAERAAAERHEEYERCLESVVNGSAAYGIAPQVLGSVVRICMHPHIHARPSRVRDAFEFCRAPPLSSPMRPATWSRMPGSPHWGSSPDASGSRLTGTTRALPACRGAPLSSVPLVAASLQRFRCARAAAERTAPNHTEQGSFGCK